MYQFVECCFFHISSIFHSLNSLRICKGLFGDIYIYWFPPSLDFFFFLLNVSEDGDLLRFLLLVSVFHEGELFLSMSSIIYIFSKSGADKLRESDT